MANGISKNPLTDISKVYLNQIAEGSLKNLEKASVLAMSDDPKDQDKAREIKTRFDYQSLMKQKKAKKAVKEDVKRDEYGDPIGGPKISKKQKAKNLKANTPDEQHTTATSEAFSDWRHDLREIIAADEASDEPEIKEKKVKNKIKINPEFKEAVEELGGELLEVQEVDPKKQEQMKRKEKMLKKRMLRMKLRAVNQTGGEDIVAGYEPEGETLDERQKDSDNQRLSQERGRSNYGKASIRNVRATGTGGNAADPAERLVAMDARHKAHKAKRGVKTKGMKEETLDEKCWKGYTKKGMKTMFGKRYPNCVKKEEVEVDECWKTHKQQGYKKKGGKMVPNCVPKNEEVEMTRKAYSKIHKDFKSDNPKKPRTTKYVPGKGTVSMPVKFVDEATRYAKETGKSFKSGKPVTKGGTAKDDKAFQAVAKKYAGQMMGGPQKKKVRGQKPDESNTPFKRAAARVKQIKIDNKALADKAKKAGYKSTQDYVNVQAVRKGGLGT